MFVLLDVPGVLDDPGAVQDQALAVSVGQGPDGAEVLQAERVLAIGEGLQAHDGDLAALQELLEPSQVDVAGEELGLVVADVGDLHVARGQDVDAGAGVGGQLRTSGHHGGRDQLDAPQDVVGGADIGVSQDLVHGLFQALEVPGSGIGLVADELARQLLLGHGARAERAHVEGDLGGSQVEDVEMGLRQVLLALLEGGEGDRSDRLDFVRLVRERSGHEILLL